MTHQQKPAKPDKDAGQGGSEAKGNSRDADKPRNPTSEKNEKAGT